MPTPDPHVTVEAVSFWPPNQPDTDTITLRYTDARLFPGSGHARLDLPYDDADAAGLTPPDPTNDPPEVMDWKVLVSATARSLADNQYTEWDEADVPDDPAASPVVAGVGPAMAVVYDGHVIAGADRQSGVGPRYDLLCDPPDVAVLDP